MTHISSRVASWMNHCKKSHCILSEEWRAESINKTHVVVVKSRRVINATKTRLSRSYSSREGNVSGLRGSGVTVQTARCSGSLCHAKIVGNNCSCVRIRDEISVVVGLCSTIILSEAGSSQSTRCRIGFQWR